MPIGTELIIGQWAEGSDAYLAEGQEPRNAGLSPIQAGESILPFGCDLQAQSVRGHATFAVVLNHK
jgi:hypothetical protein